MRLDKKFFEQNTLKVARALLGKTLVRRWRGHEIRGMISETEAYKGFADRASHASRGQTARNAVMFEEAGRAYVYLIYGMHNCLNVVCERQNYPAAVLIRGVMPANEQIAPLNGPGKVCKFFHIDRAMNREDITKSSRLWIEDNPTHLNILKSRNLKIRHGTRIGIDYAGEWKDKPWRFYLHN